jgi:hypothetical protein
LASALLYKVKYQRPSCRERDNRAVARPPAGLCDSCAHQRLIRNTRGSSFSLCERSKTDPAYPKYPRLPVGECAGFEARAAGAPG